MIFPLLILLHLLGAAIWTGGHLVLAAGVLPAAWRRRDPNPIRAYEAAFERIGLPALATQVVTGIWLATFYVPGFWGVFHPSSPIAWLILTKLGCLAGTVALAIHARLWLIPRLSPATLPRLGWHILAVTVLAVLFTLAGGLIRCGGW
jgi:putative copper export protein